MTETLRAYAKINLFLDVTGRRSDGYHDILSLMQTVSLYDTVTVSVEDDESGAITLACDSSAIPCDGRNLAYRAAEAFYNALGYRKSTHIRVEKRIPVSAGLAGGSTDAAAVLVGLNRLCGMPFSEDKLCTVGKALGADIPFCILGGTAEVCGIGEVLAPLPDLPIFPMVVAKLGDGVSTPEAYRLLDGMFEGFAGKYAGGTVCKERYGALLAALRDTDSKRVAESIYNIFEYAILPKHGEASELKRFFLSNGAIGAMMSGSGPSVFGIFEDIETARRAADRLNKDREAPIAFAVTPVSRHERG